MMRNNAIEKPQTLVKGVENREKMSIFLVIQGFAPMGPISQISVLLDEHTHWRKWTVNKFKTIVGSIQLTSLKPMVHIYKVQSIH